MKRNFILILGFGTLLALAYFVVRDLGVNANEVYSFTGTGNKLVSAKLTTAFPVYKESTKRRRAEEPIELQNTTTISTLTEGISYKNISSYRTQGSASYGYQNSRKSSSDQIYTNTQTPTPLYGTRSMGSKTLAMNTENISVNGLGTQNSVDQQGPMRLFGDGELPPPEGVPVGEGVIFLLVLSASYAAKRVLKA